MDESNKQILKLSNAKVKLLFDANVLSYAEHGFQETGYHLLEYMSAIEGVVDWYVGSRVAVNLYNNGILPGVLTNLLNCDYPDMKMDHFPYIKQDGSAGFVKLNKLAPDDWAQIVLAYNHQELVLVTNDSKMLKSAHAVTNGRVIDFHNFIEGVTPYWHSDEGWIILKKWFDETIGPVRNNSSWLLPTDAYQTIK